MVADFLPTLDHLFPLPASPHKAYLPRPHPRPSVSAEFPGSLHKIRWRRLCAPGHSSVTAPGLSASRLMAASISINPASRASRHVAKPLAPFLVTSIVF